MIEQRECCSFFVSAHFVFHVDGDAACGPCFIESIAHVYTQIAVSVYDAMEPPDSDIDVPRVTEAARERVADVLGLVERWTQVRLPHRDPRFSGQRLHQRTRKESCDGGHCSFATLTIQCLRYHNVSEHQHDSSMQTHKREGPRVGSEWYTHVPYNAKHVCLRSRQQPSTAQRGDVVEQDHCVDPELHHAIERHVLDGYIAWTTEPNSVFVCTETGRLHWCGEMCEYRHNDRTDDKTPSTYVVTCPISGRTHDDTPIFETRFSAHDTGWKDRQENYANTFIRPRCQANIKINDWCRELMSRQRIMDIKTFVDQYTRESAAGDHKKAYLMVAISRIWMLLCDECTENFKRARASRDRLGQTIIKDRVYQYQVLLERSERRGGLSRCPMLMIADVERDYARVCSRQHLSEQAQVENAAKYMIQYSHMIMAVWVRVQECQQGHQAPIIPCNMATFKRFVLPCLYILRDGLTVFTTKTHGCDVMLYTANQQLKRTLPDASKLAFMFSNMTTRGPSPPDARAPTPAAPSRDAGARTGTGTHSVGVQALYASMPSFRVSARRSNVGGMCANVGITGIYRSGGGSRSDSAASDSGGDGMRRRRQGGFVPAVGVSKRTNRRRKDIIREAAKISLSHRAPQAVGSEGALVLHPTVSRNVAIADNQRMALVTTRIPTAEGPTCTVHDVQEQLLSLALRETIVRVITNAIRLDGFTVSQFSIRHMEYALLDRRYFPHSAKMRRFRWDQQQQQQQQSAAPEATSQDTHGALTLVTK